MAVAGLPAGARCPRCTTPGVSSPKRICGCRCDCHHRGFALYPLPNLIIEPIRLPAPTARDVFAELGSDWVAITGPVDGAGSGRAGIRLELTADEIDWRATRGLTISVPPECFQEWRRALAEAQWPARRDRDSGRP